MPLAWPIRVSAALGELGDHLRLVEIGDGPEPRVSIDGEIQVIVDGVDGALYLEVLDVACHRRN